jgi:RNA polymerase sigma factor (sigma-70 family)
MSERGAELLGFVRGLMQGHPDAEDVCSQVFLEAVYKADQLDDTPRAWLFQAARWRVIDWKRAQCRHKDIPFVAEIGPLSDAMEEQVLNRVFGRSVWETTPNMTPLQRIAFWHVYAEDRSIKEVSEWMGLSQVAVKALLHRAKAHLSRNLTLNSAPI